MSGHIGRWVAWLIVLAAVISAGNAVVRKILHTSSNSWLEVQWWLFAAVFLLAAPWTLALNEHIRIDVVSNYFSKRQRNAVEMIGHIFFLLPAAAMIVFTSWHYFLTSWAQNEQSQNAGGLPQWPIKALIPIAFTLLFVQGVSELIKRIAIIRGDLPEPGAHDGYHDIAVAAGASSRRTTIAPTTNAEIRTHRATTGTRGTMLALVAENMAPIMFVALVVTLLLGYPVAFSLGAVGLIFFVVGVELAPHSSGVITLSWSLLQSMPGRIYDVMRNDTLLAIPFFTFMGLILERSGMAEDLLETVGQLFGTLRGGLAYAVIFVGALLAATTGVVAASVISMGLISLPIMLRYGYDRQLAAGVIAASGTLAQIIPPSLVLIVLSDQLGRSVDDMYKGAIVPGLLLAGLYAVYVLIVSLWKPSVAPGLPLEEVGHRKADGSRGLPSLGVLAAISAVFGWWMMQGSSYQGVDLFILAMAWSIGFALVAALANRGLQMVAGAELPVAAGRACHLRDGAAAVAHIPGARHHSRRPRDADRGWRHGRRRGYGLGCCSPLRDRRRRRVQRADRAPGRRGDGQAVGVRDVHSHRRADFLAHFLRGQWPHLGGAPADLDARRHVRLPHRRQRSRVLPRLLPRLLRAGFHSRAAVEAGRRSHLPQRARRPSPSPRASASPSSP